MATLECIACRLEQYGLRILYTLSASKRIGETDPPASGFRINLYQVAGNRGCHVPLLGCHVEINTRPKDLVAGLFVRRDLLKSQRSIVEHSQLEIGL